MASPVDMQQTQQQRPVARNNAGQAVNEYGRTLTDAEIKAQEKKNTPKENTSGSSNAANAHHGNSQNTDKPDLSWDDANKTGYNEEEIEVWKQLRSKPGKFDGASLESKLTGMRKADAKLRKRLEAIAVKSGLYGVGGMPATYIDNTDPPLPGVPNGLGQQYVNSVVRYGTFIAFQPGVITWNISGLAADNIINAGNIGHIARKFISGGVDFNQPKLFEYWKEVARHCRVAILLMGIEDLGVNTLYFGSPGGTADYMGALDMTKNNMKEGTSNLSFRGFQHFQLANIGAGFANAVIGGIPASLTGASGQDDQKDSGFVVFYTDGPIEASDTLSNQSEPSPFKQALDNMMGSTDEIIRDVVSKTINTVGAGNNDILTFLGGNPVIPDVWSDSSFDKAYTCTIKLVSAAGDPVSVFMNIIFPLIKICCLAVPLGTGGYYGSPPILRVYSQGVINTDYGLIESMTINRKMETLNDWGMPTEVDVQLSIKDLNPHLYREMDGWFRSGLTMGTSFTTFLATICGVNVTTLTRGQKMVANDALYTQWAKYDGTFKNIIRSKVTQGWADIATNWIYGLENNTRNIKLAAGRIGQIFSESVSYAGDAAGTTYNAAREGVNSAVGAVGKGLGFGSR